MPSRLGRYAVRRRIGAGGFATVWLAYDEQLDSPVAVKVLADNWTEDQHVRQRFLEEGRYLRRVESPHVVSVYDAGELEDGRPYLVMTYADQGTLADRLEVGGLTPAQAMEVIRQVGAGLTALHQRDILHRDVKPANVLFRTAEGEVRAMVADLGLGKALDVSSRLTMIAGTPSFVAPEQAQAEPLDARADLYSLAALTYLLLAGRAPYAHADLAAAARPQPPLPISTPERPFSDQVDAVVRRGLAIDRDERWPDVATYVDALADALGEPVGGGVSEPWLPLDPQLTQPGARPSPMPATGPLGDPTPPPGRRRRRLVGAFAGLVVLAGGGGVGFVLQQQLGGQVTVTDDEDTISVTVPDDWEEATSTRGWDPPNAEGAAEFPAVSVGTSPTWTTAGTGAEGVFAGILPGTELPEQLPQHPECGKAGERMDDSSALGSSATVAYSSCPDGVTIERVVQVTTTQLLWVQVRSADRATANDVLDSVELHGM
jgi:hypothetical protein